MSITNAPPTLYAIEIDDGFHREQVALLESLTDCLTEIRRMIANQFIDITLTVSVYVIHPQQYRIFRYDDPRPKQESQRDDRVWVYHWTEDALDLV